MSQFPQDPLTGAEAAGLREILHYSEDILRGPRRRQAFRFLWRSLLRPVLVFVAGAFAALQTALSYREVLQWLNEFWQ